MNLTHIYVSKIAPMSSACRRHEFGMSSALFDFWDGAPSAPNPQGRGLSSPDEEPSVAAPGLRAKRSVHINQYQY